MQEHYQFERFEETSPVETHINAVEDSMSEIGRPVDLMGHLQAKPGTDLFNQGFLITPDYTDALENYLDNLPWLSIGEEIDGYFGNPTGSTEITHVVLENDLSVGDVVDLLDTVKFTDGGENSMLETMEVGVSLLCKQAKNPDNPSLVIAYDLLRKSLGWEAERLLDSTGDFKKAAASHDKWGVDLMARSDKWSDYDFSEKAPDLRGFQLKTMQRVTSQSLHLDDHEHPHLSYGWTNDGLILSDMDERRSSDNQAKAMGNELGCTGTVTKKSLKSGTTADYHRPARIIAKL